MKVTIKYTHSNLEYAEYEFYLLDNKLVLDSFKLMRKESTVKRKYEVINIYSRIPHNARQYQYTNKLITADKVPITDAIRQDAIRELTNNIKIDF